MKNLSVFLPSARPSSMGSAEDPGQIGAAPADGKKSVRAAFEETVPFDCQFDRGVWRDAPAYRDFLSYPDGKSAAPRVTELKLLYTEKDLYLGITAFDPKAEIRSVAGERSALWGGDVFEIFFGSTEKRPYVLQFVIGSGGGRFAGDGDYGSWEGKAEVFPDSWRAVVKVPLSKLHFENFATGFNLCRLKKSTGTYMVLNSVGRDFYAIARYGELILGSYARAAEAKFQKPFPGTLSRAEYEKLCAERIPAVCAIRHGPWLHDPAADGMTVGWASAGGCFASLEYRQARSTEAFRTIRSHAEHAVLDSSEKIHSVRMENLIPGTEYEYRVRCVHPDGEREAVSEVFRFRTVAESAENLDFAVFTDLHNQTGNLEKLLKLPGVGSCDLLVNAGDMLTNSTGEESIFDAYLDAETFLASRIPLLNIRGNHEFRGCAPLSFFRVFPHRTGKTFRLVRLGETCLVIFDGGEDFDAPDTDALLKEEHAWLGEAVKTPAFVTAKHRIAIAHMPILDPDASYTKHLLKITDGIFTGENPSAKIDLFLGGHTHEASFTPPGSDKAELLCADGTTVPAVRTPFPVLCNDGPGGKGTVECSLLLVRVSSDGISVRILDFEGGLVAERRVK